MNLLLQQYDENKDIIKSRLEDFSKIKDDNIFYELCYCLLTPQSSARLCWDTILKLKENDFLNKEIDILPILDPRVRFHINKSKYLIEARQNYKKLKEKLDEIKDPSELREFLVKNVKGLGYKEASHFLRNIGYRGLAILDRHILKNLLRYRVIDELPKTLTKKKYFEIENKFKRFADKININIDELDLLLWSKETGEVFK